MVAVIVVYSFRRQHEAFREAGSWSAVGVSKDKWKTLRHIVADTGRTANDLISEAIDMLAGRYRRRSPARSPRLHRRAAALSIPRIAPWRQKSLIVTMTVA
jgi:hypothetical protein